LEAVLFYIYLTIVAAVLVLIIWNFLNEEDWRKKVGDAMVIIPLLMRLFLIK